MNLPKRWIAIPLVRRPSPERNANDPVRTAAINADRIDSIKPTSWTSPAWAGGTVIHVNAEKLVTSLSMDEVLGLVNRAQGEWADYHMIVPAEAVEYTESDLHDDSGD